MDSVDYKYHAFMAETADCSKARTLHKRICLLIDNGESSYDALAEISLTESRLFTMSGERVRAGAALQDANRYFVMAGDSRWTGTYVCNDSVSEEFRDDCGRIRREIARIVGSSVNTKNYIKTVPGLTDDHRRQIIEIYDLTNGGVHLNINGFTPVFDTSAAMEYILSVEPLTKTKPDWRSNSEKLPFRPTPSAFHSTITMKSSRAKIQTATVVSKGW